MIVAIVAGVAYAIIMGFALGYSRGYARGFEEAKKLCEEYPPLFPKSWQDAYKDRNG